MTSLECPWCGSPMRVDDLTDGSEARCSSCGRTLLVSSVNGVINFIVPPPVLSPARPHAPARKKNQLYDKVLPIIVPLVCFGAILATIAIRLARDVRDTGDKPVVVVPKRPPSPAKATAKPSPQGNARRNGPVPEQPRAGQAPVQQPVALPKPVEPVIEPILAPLPPIAEVQAPPLRLNEPPLQNPPAIRKEDAASALSI
jgi:hypothetical protein